MKLTWKKFLAAALMVTTCAFVAGCGGDSSSSSSSAKKEIKMGVTAGPQAEVMEKVKEEAAKDGITINIVEFNDYVQPDMALAEKDLDMNSMQHQPFLDNIVEKKGLKLKSIGKTILMPMAAYSKKYKSLDELPNGAKVTLPNDPSNGGRALLLLQQAGLIKLSTGNDINATVANVSENPKNLQFIELEAAQVPRSMDDSDLACVNTNYALPAGLNPKADSLILEDVNSPYACVMAVREGDENNETYQKVLKVYHSEPVKKFIDEHFQGSIIPAF